MGVDRNATPQSVEALLKAVDGGTLGIPEFQRDFVWSPQQISELVRTVARDWPCGTFLLQRGPLSYRAKAIEGGPPLRGSPSLLVLDGQQRLTALYHVLKEHGDETYYVRINDAIISGELDDDHVAHMKASRYKRLYPNLAAEAHAGFARVSTLARDEEFFAWASHLSMHGPANAIHFRTTQLSGLKHYSIPCVILPEDTPLEAVVKIFETINRTGVLLDAFDLMVAKLHPHDFNLRTEFEDAVSCYPILEQFHIEGLDVLRVIALAEHLAQVDSRDFRRPGPLRIKGIRRSDVIDLDAVTVKSHWPSAVTGLVESLKFLREKCGVACDVLAPPKSVVLVLAYVIGNQVPMSTHMQRELGRWFWWTCFSQTHAQGANTQAIRDARILRTVRDGAPLEVPNAEAAQVTPEQLHDSRKRNDALLRGLLCSIVEAGGRDLMSGAPLRSMENLEIIPLFPERLTARAPAQQDSIVNYFVGTADLRRFARGRAPSELFGQFEVNAIESQSLPIHAVKSDDWMKFIQERTSTLLCLASRRLAGQ